MWVQIELLTFATINSTIMYSKQKDLNKSVYVYVK